MRRRGFTLLEMMVTITVLAVSAAVLLPSFRDEGRLRLVGAVSVLRSDLELAQVMTMTDPDDPVLVVFDPALDRYWLARADDPDTPAVLDGAGTPYLVVLGAGRAASAAGVELSTLHVKDNRLAFNPHGGLVDFADTARITLELGEHRIHLDVSPVTGTITETEG